MKSLFELIVWCLLSFSAGIFGAQFKPGEWYATLNKPLWTPPPILFPIVWPVLYALMGLAAWLIGRERHANPAANTALILFAFQLILNALWSWIFFGRHEIGWAFIEIIALWGAILTTLFAFYRIRPLAGALLVPYLLWVGFAAILTGTIFVKN